MERIISVKIESRTIPLNTIKVLFKYLQSFIHLTSVFMRTARFFAWTGTQIQTLRWSKSRSQSPKVSSANCTFPVEYTAHKCTEMQLYLLTKAAKRKSLSFPLYMSWWWSKILRWRQSSSMKIRCIGYCYEVVGTECKRHIDLDNCRTAIPSS